MMKKRKYIYILLSLIYMDLVFNLFAYDSYLKTSQKKALYRYMERYLKELLKILTLS